MSDVSQAVTVRITEDDLADIRARAEAHSGGYMYPDARLAAFALVAEVEALRAALDFKRGEIEDLSARVAELEAEHE